MKTRPANQLPSAIPPMKALRTTPIATGVVPSDSSSSRTQTTSKIREVAPVTKKAHSRTDVARRVLTFALFGTRVTEL